MDHNKHQMGINTPPGRLYRLTGLHWVHLVGEGGEILSTMALQWNAGSETWTRSNEHDIAGKQGIDPARVRWLVEIPHWQDLQELLGKGNT